MNYGDEIKEKKEDSNIIMVKVGQINLQTKISEL